MNLKEIRSSLLAEDNKALRYIYLEYGTYCTKILVTKKGCTKEEAEDLFIESVMNFREKVLNGSIQELTNTKYYLFKTCENVYLARLKSDKRKKGKASDIEHFYYSSQHVYGDEEFDPDMMESTKRSWDELSEKCKDILYYFYIDSIRLAEIAKLMSFSTVDVAKTSKARCYKKLMTAAREYYKKLKN